MHLCVRIVCFLLLLYLMITLMFYFFYWCFFLFLVCANECLYKFAIKNYKYNT